MKIDKFIEKAIYIRELETYFLEMFSRGVLNGTVHTCVGQELIPVVISHYLKKEDKIFSNHRGHGHYIADQNSAKKLILELMGRSSGISGGIGGSQHIATESFISNGIQGGLAPISVGYSFVQKLRNSTNISICYVGDGTLGEGQFYEALVLAGMFNTPTLFVIENNGYAQSTSNFYTLKGDVRKRIEGFNITFLDSNIWDIEDLDNKSKEAIANTRNGNPTVLAINCYRLNSHSKGDDNRSQSEISEYTEKDLINLYIKENPEWFQKYRTDCREEFDNVVENADSSDFDISFLENKAKIESELKWGEYEFLPNQAGKRLNESINSSLDYVIDKYSALLIGEDIIDKTPKTPIQYGGAFKVTKGLSEKYPHLVRSSSISEAGITGFGIGSALAKNPCIVEIMFGDFMTLCVDQLVQQASKIPTMYGSNIDLPLVVRTPMGGRRGYGPTHSQNLEKLFLFWPNIDVIAINCLCNTDVTYENAITNGKTTIVIEDKVSYTQKSLNNAPVGYQILQSDEPFPTYVLDPDFAKPNVLIVAYGSMLREVIEVLPDLIDDEIFPKVISPTRLSPLNVRVFENLNFNDIPCIFVEEGSKRSAWSSEVIASLAEIGKVFRRVIRISNEYIIPCAKDVEEKIIPSKHNLAATIRKRIR